MYKVRYKFKVNQVFFLTITLFLTFGINSIADAQSVEPGNEDTTGTETPVLPQELIINQNMVLQNPQQVNSVLELRADKDTIKVFEQVNFFLEPVDQVINTSNEFTFHIGNEIIELNNNQSSLAYRFSEAGRYVVSVSVKVQTDDDVFVTPQIVPDSLIIQVDSFGLVVSPVQVGVGEPVTLRADFTSNGLDVQYRFIFGNGDSSDWDTSPRITHTYSQSGLYQVFAEIRTIVDNQINTQTRSITRNVVVRPNLQPEVQVQTLTLEADREEVYTGEDVRFTLNPSEVVTSTPFTFIFDFGDGNRMNKETGTAEIFYHYDEPGNYTVSVTRDSNPVFANQNVAIPDVQNTVEIKVDSVPLIVNPSDSTETGDPVTFETVFWVDDPQIQYRFFFGDNSGPSQWGIHPNIEHTYTNSGMYRVYAEIGRQSGDSVDVITSSVIKTVAVTVSDSGLLIPWWVYVLAAVLGAAGFYTVRNYGPVSSTGVKIYTRSDQGHQTMGGRKILGLNYKVRLNPNFKEGNYSVKTNESGIIKKIERST